MTTERDRTAKPIDEADLNALVDGQLTDERRIQALDFLASNPEARDRVEAYRRQQALFASLRAGLESVDDTRTFRPELQAALEQAFSQQSRWHSVVRGVTGLAAGVALVIGSYVGFRYLEMESPIPQAQTAAFSPELTFGGGFIAPAKLTPAAEGEAAMVWLGDHLGNTSLVLPDLGALGLQLTGGSILTDSLAPAVRLTYSDGKAEHVLLYMGVVDSDAEQAVTLMPEGLLSLHWRRGQMVFALVGSIESPELLDIMRLVNDGVVQTPAAEVASRDGIDVTVPSKGKEEPVLKEVGLAGNTATASPASAAPVSEPASDAAKVAPAVKAVPPTTSTAAGTPEQPKPL